MLSNLSNMSEKVNGPILAVSAICILILLAVTGFMVYFSIRYSRRRNPVSSEVQGNALLEIAWTVLPTLIAFALFWYGWVGYKYMKDVPADAMVVKVTGRQWSWSHEYANGVTSPELNVPVGKPVRLNLHSTDVIHSYYIPAFKVKQDLVPGNDKLYLWFVANKTGRYDVLCAEYCGLRHSAMHTYVNVMPQGKFDAWYKAEGEKVARMKATLAAATKGAQPAAATGEGALVAVGRKLYEMKGCVACHSVDGSRLIGPSFKGIFGHTVTVLTAGHERSLQVDAAYIRKSIIKPTDDIVKGYQPLMPSQQGIVTDSEINALVAYIKSLSK